MTSAQDENVVVVIFVIVVFVVVVFCFLIDPYGL